MQEYLVWDHTRVHLLGRGQSVDEALEDAEQRHRGLFDKERCSVWLGDYHGVQLHQHFISHDLGDLERDGACVWAGAKAYEIVTLPAIAKGERYVFHNYGKLRVRISDAASYDAWAGSVRPVQGVSQPIVPAPEIVRPGETVTYVRK